MVCCIDTAHLRFANNISLWIDFILASKDGEADDDVEDGEAEDKSPFLPSSGAGLSSMISSIYVLAAVMMTWWLW